MLRHLSPVALVLSFAALTAPASQASPSMCVGRERCGITRGHEGSGLTRSESGQLVVVVPMRSDGSQHGGISHFQRGAAGAGSRTAL
jgi:hypothetical protein